MAQILLVDDEPAARWVLADLLSAEGHQCEEAEDGLEALAAFRGREFDLVLSDVRMPRMDGFQLLRELRSRAEGRVPLLFLSGHAEQRDVDEALGSGAAGYLVKPCDAGRIVDAVTRALLASARPRVQGLRRRPSAEPGAQSLPAEPTCSAVVGRSRIVCLPLPPKVDPVPPAASGEDAGPLRGTLRAAARLLGRRSRDRPPRR